MRRSPHLALLLSAAALSGCDAGGRPTVEDASGRVALELVDEANRRTADDKTKWALEGQGITVSVQSISTAARLPVPAYATARAASPRAAAHARARGYVP